jgi:hypothetical protein
MTSELDALRIEVAQLRQSVRELQDRGRTPWGARRAAAACFALVLGLFLARIPTNEAHATAQDDKDKGKELVCSSLRLVGAGGKNLLTLGGDADGGKLQFFGVDGKIRGELVVADKQGPGMINLFDANAKRTVYLGNDKNGGMLQIFGGDGKLRADLFVADKQGPGAMNLCDANGKRTVFLGTDEDGGIMEIYGLDGKIRTIVAVAPNQGGGLVNLFDTKKKLRIVMEGTDMGAVIEKR